MEKFFAVRKSRFSSDLQATKKRKVESVLDDNDETNNTESQTRCEAVASSVLDESALRSSWPNASKLFSTPKASGGDGGENRRKSKRDSMGIVKTDDDTESKNAEKLFDIGSSTQSVKIDKNKKVGGVSAKRRLKLGSTKTQPSIVPFLKLAQLSPKKAATPPRAEISSKDTQIKPKVVEFAKKAPLSPNKKTSDVASISAELKSLRGKVEKSGKDATKRAEIQKRLKGVSGLADLQARLRSVSKKTQSLNKAQPSLSKEPLTLEVCSPIKQRAEEKDASKVDKSSKKLVLASPKKTVVESESEFKNLIERQPTSRLCLPDKYEELAKCFAHFDQIACIRYNRRQAVKVESLLRDVQKVRRRDFKQSHLQQMNCVFPQAHRFSWERVGGIHNKLRQNFELHCTPNAHYIADLIHALRQGGKEDHNYTKKEHKILSAKDLTQRSKVFRANLLAMVEEEHLKFVNENLDLKLDKSQKVTAWHPQFSPNDMCQDIEPRPLPPKPITEGVQSARDALQLNRSSKHNNDEKLMKINPKLLMATRKLMVDDSDTATASMEPTKSKAPQVLKGLEGLNKSLLDRVLAKEKEKQLRDMLRPKHDIDDFAFLDKLLDVSSSIANCYRQKRSSGAMELVTFATFVADSVNKINGKDEAEKMVRRLAILVPKFFQVKRFQRAEFVRMDDHCTDHKESMQTVLAKAIRDYKEENKDGSKA